MSLNNKPNPCCFALKKHNQCRIEEFFSQLLNTKFHFRFFFFHTKHLYSFFVWVSIASSAFLRIPALIYRRLFAQIFVIVFFLWFFVLCFFKFCEDKTFMIRLQRVPNLIKLSVGDCDFCCCPCLCVFLLSELKTHSGWSTEAQILTKVNQNVVHVGPGWMEK